MNNGKNVIWFIADQMRADVMSCNGDPNINTPNLDLLSEQGMNFEQAVSGCPLCAPYRGSLLTSRYVHQSTVPGHDYSLNQAMPVITDVFHEEGYDTLYYGKWHLDGDIPRKGTDIDPKRQLVTRDRRARFKTWVGYENNNSQFDCFVHGHDGDREIPLTRLESFETDALTDMVIEKIRNYGRKRMEDDATPFFMVLSVQPPHDPYTAPTTLGLCGIDVPEWMDGFDYSFERIPCLRKTEKEIPDSAYLQSVIPTRHDHSIDKPYRGIVTVDGYKYVCFEDQDWLMFDLNKDPFELVNLAHHPLAVEKRVELNNKLRTWVEGTGDVFTVPKQQYQRFPIEYVTYSKMEQGEEN